MIKRGLSKDQIELVIKSKGSFTIHQYANRDAITRLKCRDLVREGKIRVGLITNARIFYVRPNSSNIDKLEQTV